MLDRLKARRPRLGCLVGTLVLAPALSCVVAMAAATIEAPTEVPAAIAASAFERERGVAQGLGLVAIDEQVVAIAGSREHVVTIPVGAGRCVAVIAAAWGYAHVGDLVLREVGGGAALGEHTSPSGLVSHAQWCARDARTIEASIGIHPRDGAMERAEYTAAQLRYVVLTGPLAGGARGLVRGRLTARGSSEVPREALLARAGALAGARQPLGPDVSVSNYRARLVPESTSAYQRLVEHAQNETATVPRPHVDLLDPSTPPGWRPLVVYGGEVPFVNEPGSACPAVGFSADGTARRVLAVIEPAALRAGCVHVQLVRMRLGEVRDVTRLQTGAALSVDDNVAYETVCDGAPVTYTAASTDDAEYTLRLLAE